MVQIMKSGMQDVNDGCQIESRSVELFLTETDKFSIECDPKHLLVFAVCSLVKKKDVPPDLVSEIFKSNTKQVPRTNSMGHHDSNADMSPHWLPTNNIDTSMVKKKHFFQLLHEPHLHIFCLFTQA